ncbi:unnamed protein product [Blepharisma stoltei]|uniref:NHR domain-containing protein n=1 Tax=Blepharisma stoltei TaxID=1481888 RepID=A0AAU9JPY1_9CILI|nr:unnamed protein product [Blepharisma stoltei]
MEIKVMYFLQQRPEENNSFNKKKKTKFHDIIQIFEIPNIKDSQTGASSSIKQLENIALGVIKASQIDGRKIHSNNYYIKRYDLDGICTDLRTGEASEWDMHPQAIQKSHSRRGILKKKNVTIEMNGDFDYRSRDGFQTAVSRSKSSSQMKLIPIENIWPRRQSNVYFHKGNVRQSTENLKRANTSSSRQKSHFSSTALITLSPLFK